MDEDTKLGGDMGKRAGNIMQKPNHFAVMCRLESKEHTVNVVREGITSHDELFIGAIGTIVGEKTEGLEHDFGDKRYKKLL